MNRSVACTWQGQSLGAVHVEAIRHLDDRRCEIRVSHSIGATDEKVLLHWGVTYSPQGNWACPPRSMWPDSTSSGGDQSAETAMLAGAQALRIVVPPDSNVFDVKFVIKRITSDGEQWFGTDNGDFCVTCRAPDGKFAGARVLRDESGAGASIYGRYSMVMDLLDAAQADEEVMAWLYIVLRLHHGKKLRWYGKYNYQSKDIAHLQDVLSRRMALAATYAPNRKSRRLARMAMSFLSRGGGMAEQIRLQILDMMRRHGIKEGHRPGIEDRFIEQWHQKLHQNTTADDVVICEAYLHFLHTGKEGDFWRALWDRGRLSREQLATMPNPITASPLHLPQLIPDMQRYLWTLKTVHAGADLAFMIESGKWTLEQAGDREAVKWLHEIRDNFGAWWIPGRIAQARARLRGPLKNVFAAERDVLLLDSALESGFRTAVERTDVGALSGDSLVELVDLVLSQIVLSTEDDEYESCLRQWRTQVKDSGRWTPAWALRAAAAGNRLTLLMERGAREMQQLLQGKAEELARAARIADAHVTSFSEEVVRGQCEFLLSILLHRLTPMLRKTAGLGRWSIASLGTENGRTVGRVGFVGSLSQAQGRAFSDPAVLVAETLDGADDIPAGVVAVLTARSVDVLSHVAIRARNQRVLLASSDAEALSDVKSRFKEGDFVSIGIPSHATDGQLAIASTEAGAVSGAGTGISSTRRKLNGPVGTARSLVRQADFKPGMVGAKSVNLARLASIHRSMATSESVALPFGTMEAALGLAANARVANATTAYSVAARNALAIGDARAMSYALAELRAEVTSCLCLDSGLESALREVLGAFELPATELHALWNAVKQVWASKWTDRAFLARAKAGIPDTELFMAVLIQKTVPADYAFVVHTTNPLAANGASEPATMMGEVVVGLGETLAASHLGRPFSFIATRGQSAGDFRILSYPSKLAGLFADRSRPGLMVRSDSNGEDLEESAGAGLYDSLACGGSIHQEAVDYARCTLVVDEGFRHEVMTRLRQTARDVEDAMGGRPQDIEGVVCDGRVTVVQTRPQVGLAPSRLPPQRLSAK